MSIFFFHTLKEYVTESRFEGSKMSVVDFFLYYKEMKKDVHYSVFVEQYWEGETTVFSSYTKAKRFYNKMCKYDNVIVHLDGPSIHLTNGKEYLRG